MPYTHGGDIYGDAAVELDFSVNTNRLGMPQAVRDAVMASAAAWEQYPARVWKRCFGYFICSCLSDSAQTGDFAGTGIFGV